MVGSRATATRRRTHLSLGVLVAVVLLLLTGCGGSGGGAERDGASAAVRECRAQWRQLAEDYTKRAEGTKPSDLGSRWTALASGASYQSTGSTSTDCTEAIADTEKRAASITALSRRLVRFDLVAAQEQMTAKATKALAGKTRPARAARINKALQQLQLSAGEATADMRDGWTAANSIDLDDKAKVAQLIRDLTFLAGDSAPYAQGQAALRQLRQLT